MALSLQHERFCREYVIDLNGSAAYWRAYPKVKSEKVARTNAARLLANASVSARVRELQQAAVARSDLTADKVLRELAFVAFQRTRQVYREDGSLKSPGEWDEATDATIASVETEDVLQRNDTREPQGHGGALNRSALASVVGQTHKVKRWDKVKALELLMKHFGLLKEDGPHQDRQQFDLSKMAPNELATLLAALRPLFAPAHLGGSGTA